MKYLALSLIILSFSLPAKEIETIHWAKYDIKPFFFLTGEHKNKGIVDLLFQLLQNQMPQYQHENYVSAIPRILRDLKQTKLVCSGLLKRGTDNSPLLYSLPTLQVPSHSIQFHKEHLEYMKQITGLSFNKPISLKSLIKSNANISIGITKGRHYGPEISALIQQYPNQFISHSGQIKINQYIKLTQKKRVTFALEYPFVSFYSFNKDTNPPYHSTALTDTSPHLLGYIACTDTPAGKRAISEINKVVASQWLNPNYRSIVENWLPKESLARYKKHYKDLSEMFK